MSSEDATIKDSLKDVQALLNIIVRYVLSGGVFVLAFGYLDRWQLGFLRANNEGRDLSVYLTSLFIAVFGAVAYTLHRVVFPMLFCAIAKRVIPSASSLKTLTCTEIDRRLTEVRYQSKNEPLQAHFDRWASEVHFLFTAAWSFLFAFFFFRLKTCEPFVPRRDGIVLALSLIIFVAALSHNYRFLRDEVYRYDERPSKKAN